MPKTKSIIEFVIEAAIPVACGVAWAAAGFPHFMEVAKLGAVLACFGILYVAMIWSLKE